MPHRCKPISWQIGAAKSQLNDVHRSTSGRTTRVFITGLGPQQTLGLYIAILELAKDVELHRGHTNLPGLLIVLWFRLLLVVDRPDHFPGSEQRQVYCNVRTDCSMRVHRKPVVFAFCCRGWPKFLAAVSLHDVCNRGERQVWSSLLRARAPRGAEEMQQAENPCGIEAV